jgi:hypothetical protein
VCLLGTRRGYLGPGIRFEDVAFHIGRGDLVDILEHANRYAGQHVFIVQREDYLSLVPFVEDEHTVFLKTIIPSRKTTKQYLGDDEKALLESVERASGSPPAAANASELGTAATCAVSRPIRGARSHDGSSENQA